MADQPEDPAADPRTPAEMLGDAVRAFANTLSDDPVLVDQIVVCWEQVRYDEDGDVLRSIRYSVPAGTLAASLGLNEAAGEYLRRDILGSRGEDDD